MHSEGFWYCRNSHPLDAGARSDGKLALMILVSNGHNDDIGGDADGYADCRCNGDETEKEIKYCSCIVWMY